MHCLHSTHSSARFLRSGPNPLPMSSRVMASTKRTGGVNSNCKRASAVVVLNAASPEGSQPGTPSSSSAIVKAPSRLPANRVRLESFFFGRAAAIVFSQRVVQFVVDAATDLGKALADQPTKLRDFQEEVATLARREMSEAVGVDMSEQATAMSSGTSGSSMGSSSGSSSSSSGKKSSGQGTDMQAMVDELRAEIASTRSVIQQIKAQKAASR